MSLARAISEALRDHRANPITVNGQTFPRSDAVELLRIENLFHEHRNTSERPHDHA